MRPAPGRYTAFVSDDWIAGGKGRRVADFQGETRLQSVYAQDTWRVADDWRATLGMRVESWTASDGGH